jgi:radical SAM superfamily enzyme YgiQ (UPF0313 family)
MKNILIINPPSISTKNVVRDLIYGCWCKGKRIGGASSPPINLLYVASVLKQEGHNVCFIDALAEQKSVADICNIANAYEVIIISTSTMSFTDDTDFIDAVKKVNSSMISVIFGSHPTFMPESSFSGHSVDIIVRREPEFIIRDVIRALEKNDDSWKTVKGIGYRQDGEIVLNELYPLIEDLDSLPFLMRELLPVNVDYFNPLVKNIPYTTIMTSRGCPARCNFCTVPYFYGNKIRSRSSENIMKELEIIESQGYREVWFRDETFTVYKNRNIEVCKQILEKGIHLSWICNARVGSIDYETMFLMKKAGCHMIKFGVESGVQEILNNICKGIQIDATRKAFSIAHKIGMETHAHIMLGCPGETEDTIRTTITFVKEIDPTTVTFGICTPYPGTDLFKSVASDHPEIRDGSACNLKTVHEKSFFNEYFTHLSSEDLDKWVKKAYIAYYFRISYIFKTLRRITNMNELKRIILAGSNVFQFSLGKE